MSADNQQERLINIGWIIGFVDGEGCFSVSIFRNNTSKLGWQVFPEFAITQGAKSLSSLEFIKSFFGCGTIVLNRRHDNHKENLYKFVVRNSNDLRKIIVPFFSKYELKTSKKNDFKIFTEIIDSIVLKNHLTHSGLEKIARKISMMNRRKKSKFLSESSETKR